MSGLVGFGTSNDRLDCVKIDWEPEQTIQGDNFFSKSAHNYNKCIKMQAVYLML